MMKVNEAIQELKHKSFNDVQLETAYKWASRAAASYVLMIDAEVDKKLGFWTMAEDYYHEAIEHAALTVGNPAELVAKIQAAVAPYQEKASDHMDQILGQDVR